jgi:hypothetical protein
MNATLPAEKTERKISVVLNLADDLKGGWTNRYITDFDSKFKINALVNRNFCAPYFWSGEPYDAELIRERTLAYAYRTLYWLNNTKLQTLEDHLSQEIFVAQRLVKNRRSPSPDQLQKIGQFYTSHQKEDDYSILFNFFYGDEASLSLGYPVHGIGTFNGYDYAEYLAQN